MKRGVNKFLKDFKPKFTHTIFSEKYKIKYINSINIIT